MVEGKRAHNGERLPLALMLVESGFLAVSLINFGPPKFVWNASKSITKGFCRATKSEPNAGDLVLVRLPEWARFIAGQRQYLPKNVPGIKRISGVSGDVVCRFGLDIFVNQNRVALANSRDGLGRKLPQWSGCRIIMSDELLLLADHSNSFDGRYFGGVKTSSVIGIALPVLL
ncbi:MAG: S26 family signal peptidase, partial [Devosiaceae bacterium]|nr:S26 family signal peptidase [Devosiaceae bacterium]